MSKSTGRPAKKARKIYLDYASAAPMDSRVAAAMARAAGEDFSNPSAIHAGGLAAKKILEDSRKKIADILSAHADEIFFTSGATESNNLAIVGMVASFLPHIVTTNIEHASVLEACRQLEKEKRAKVTYVPVEPSGIVDPKKIAKAIRPDTVLVSVMYANNEIGTMQPIAEIAKAIRHYRKNHKNSSYPYFHTDATQAVNYLPIGVERLGVDLLSLNAAKIYGPKGVGALYKKRRVRLAPLAAGGDQESGLRPGTENVAGAAALARALALTERLKEKESKRLAALRDHFFKKLRALSPKIICNGDLARRLPNNVNITVPGIPSDLLVIELSARGIYASAKSACKSGDGKASHVIQAINPAIKDTDGSLRFSLGRQTAKADIDSTVRALREIFAKLDKWYN